MCHLRPSSSRHNNDAPVPAGGVHPCMKQVLSQDVKKMDNFSDEAASQYLQKMHEDDYRLSAGWHFFGTSHVINAFDGVGGTVKREAAKANIQATVTGHILTPRNLYDWSTSNIRNVKFFLIFVSK